MKKIACMLALLTGVLMLAGCGDNGVDENKSPEQIKQEVSSMDQAEISKMVELYTAEIEKKSVELKAEADKLSNIPLTSMFGDEAKGI